MFLRSVALSCVASLFGPLRCVALRSVASRRFAVRCVALLCGPLRCVALQSVALRRVALRSVALRRFAVRCDALFTKAATAHSVAGAYFDMSRKVEETQVIPQKSDMAVTDGL